MVSRKSLIKIPYATINGKLTHISQVSSSMKDEYKCPCCQAILIAKKGNQKLHHFSHHSKELECDPETVLHFIAKMIIYKQIQESISTKVEFLMEVNCKLCNKKHNGNLLKKATKVFLEQDVGGFKPDILLRDYNFKPLIGIEVIVSHFPTQQTLSLYKKHGVALILVIIETEQDLFNIDLGKFNPTYVILFPSGKCPGGKEFTLPTKQNNNNEERKILLRAANSLIECLEVLIKQSQDGSFTEFCKHCNKDTNHFFSNVRSISCKPTSDRLAINIFLLNLFGEKVGLVALRVGNVYHDGNLLDKYSNARMNYAFILVNRENIESSLDMFSNGSISKFYRIVICPEEQERLKFRSLPTSSRFEDLTKLLFPLNRSNYSETKSRLDEPAICEICGTLTKDWAVFNCSNRFCICVPCLHKQHNTSSNK